MSTSTSTIKGPWGKLIAATKEKTMVALAMQLGVTRNTIYCWIRGERTPDKFTRAAVDKFATDRNLPAPFGEK